MAGEGQILVQIPSGRGLSGMAEQENSVTSQFIGWVSEAAP